MAKRFKSDSTEYTNTEYSDCPLNLSQPHKVNGLPNGIMAANYQNDLEKVTLPTENGTDAADANATNGIDIETDATATATPSSSNGIDTTAPEDPLSSPKLLSSILSFLPPPSLFLLRQVSSHFYSTSTLLLQSSLPPLSFTSDLYDSYKMQRLVSAFLSSKEPCLYTKFEFHTSFFTLENSLLSKQFFSLFSQLIQSLTICLEKNQEFHFPLENLPALLPQLKSLTLEDHTPLHLNQDHHLQDFAPFFKSILNAAPSLERLKVSCPKRFLETAEADVSSPDSGDDFFLQHLNCSPLTHLKHLEISGKPSDLQILSLSSSSLQVTHFHLRITSAHLEESFNLLLESLKDTLVHLKLSEELKGSNFLIRFPRMTKLEKITLVSICEFENETVTFHPIQYQDSLPQLKELVLWNCFGKESRWEEFFLGVESPSLTLQRLELPTQFRNPMLAENIAVVFPNLKRLKVGFSLRPENEAVMRALLEGMGSLEELDVRTDMDEMNENIDHVFTGLNTKVCRQISRGGRYEEEDLRGMLDGVERGPSLVNLKNLRRLDIILDNNRAPFITDVTGYLAFMNMPRLKVLRFTRYGMSQECVDALKSKFIVDLRPPHGRNFFEMEYFNLDDVSTHEG